MTVGGCGGDSDDGTVQARDLSTVARIGLPVYIDDSLTKPKYLARASKFCRRSWPNILKYFALHRRERGQQDSEAELFAYSSRTYFLPDAQFWFDDISYLGAPRRDRAEIEDMLKALQWAVHSSEELRIPRPETLVAAFSSFNRLARAYGLDECLVTEARF